MIPFVLPNVLLIAEDCTAQEFCDLILTELKPVFKIQDPIQVGWFLMYACINACHLSREWKSKSKPRMVMNFGQTSVNTQFNEICVREVLFTFKSMI